MTVTKRRIKARASETTLHAVIVAEERRFIALRIDGGEKLPIHASQNRGELAHHLHRQGYTVSFQ